MNQIQFGATYLYQLDQETTQNLDAIFSPHLNELGMMEVTSEHLISDDGLDLLDLTSNNTLTVEFDKEESSVKFRTSLEPKHRGKDLKAIIEFLLSTGLEVSMVKPFQKFFPNDQHEEYTVIDLLDQVLIPQSTAGTQESLDIAPAHKATVGFVNPSTYDFMFSMIKVGDTAGLEKLLAENPAIDINMKHGEKGTPLKHAIKYDQPLMVKMLWEHPNLYKQGDYISGLFHLAVSSKSEKSLEYLITLDELDVNELVDNRTALYQASRTEVNVTSTKMLLEHSQIDPNKGYVNLKDQVYESPLYGIFNTEIVEALLKHPDIDPNKGAYWGIYGNQVQTPLFEEAYHNQYDNIKAIMAHPETAILLPSKKNRTPLRADPTDFKFKISSLLKEAGCDFRKYNTRHSAEKITKEIYKILNSPRKFMHKDVINNLEKLLYHPNLTLEHIQDLLSAKEPLILSGDYTKDWVENLITSNPNKQVFTIEMNNAITKALRVKQSQKESIDALQG